MGIVMGGETTTQSEWPALAEEGDARAQYQLGNAYRDGQGIHQDYSCALKWYQAAAEQGHNGAQFELGNIFYYGDGVPQNYTEAANWYRVAAAAGKSEWSYQAHISLGEMYAYGQGVHRDHSEAVKWIKTAARQEVVPGDAGQYAYEIGEEFFYGRKEQGAQKDIAAASQLKG